MPVRREASGLVAAHLVPLEGRFVVDVGVDHLLARHRGEDRHDLERAPGISKTMARQLYDYFHPAG